MIDCLSVLSVLKEYYSPEGTDEQLAPVCTLAVNELLPRVKNESVHSDARLISLAAAMANYRLCAKKVRNSDGVTSFKAGDVTVSVSAAALTRPVVSTLVRTALTIPVTEKSSVRALTFLLPIKLKSSRSNIITALTAAMR